ncbi:ribbon-helix-helix domain-containing protein [Notoacmeibacter sp. MSK16QG-6]|uniref:ribbon-helix-helix domain-containing protein n=1 Tax=Notoacmeibacter sp. MSK16QG-6 TaxID=2957982 RepID=UPI00209F037F|nr:ribbon-helix-helix domain-containing protein [Notoacmeibacter sp. MSK16QG-6]MCP1199660.1 ribbon-helix-helix domain-containing protein [Notoacmeibacter sp. MSK16QG-6]
MTIRKRSISIAGHRTSFSLEEPFFEALKELAVRREVSFAALVRDIDAERPKETNLSSALRLAVLTDLQSRCEAVANPSVSSAGQPSGKRSGTSPSS